MHRTRIAEPRDKKKMGVADRHIRVHERVQNFV